MTSNNDSLNEVEPTPVDAVSTDKKTPEETTIVSKESVTASDEPKTTSNEPKVDSGTPLRSPTSDAAKPQTPNAPPMPPRPPSPFAESSAILAEAFPSVDEKVRRAVLVASGGEVEAAFTALLSMSDPNFKPEEAIAHTKRSQNQRSGRGAGNDRIGQQERQIEEDERLARKLAREFSRDSAQRPSRNSYSTGRYDDPAPAEPQRSFIDDDLPEIKRSLEEGFAETRQKVNTWVANFRNRLNDNQQGGRGNMFSAFGSPPTESQYSSRPVNRRFDRDPDEITDDFQGVSLRDDDIYNDEQNLPPPPPPKRPTAVGATATVASVSALGDSTGKWEPLKSDANSDANDKDAFFIGDSDDEAEDDDTTIAKPVKDEVKESKENSKSEPKIVPKNE